MSKSTEESQSFGWKDGLAIGAGLFIAKLITRIVCNTAFMKMFLPESEMTRKVIIQTVVQLSFYGMYFMYQHKNKSKV
jgi:hypothetical protein